MVQSVSRGEIKQTILSKIVQNSYTFKLLLIYESRYTKPLYNENNYFDEKRYVLLVCGKGL